MRFGVPRARVARRRGIVKSFLHARGKIFAIVVVSELDPSPPW
jgi:hypothetical protein